MLLTVNAAALRPSLNKSFQPPLIYLSRLLAKDDYAAARRGPPAVPNPLRPPDPEDAEPERAGS